MSQIFQTVSVELPLLRLTKIRKMILNPKLSWFKPQSRKGPLISLSNSSQPIKQEPQMNMIKTWHRRIFLAKI